MRNVPCDGCGKAEHGGFAAALATVLMGMAAPSYAQLHVKGAFGPVLDWPLIPVHALVLPDGRVMTYGSDGAGAQGAQFIYDVWQPALNGEPGAHLTLPNVTATDIFCSGQILLPSSGAVLFAGGDGAINGRRNFSVSDVNRFDYRSNTAYTQPSMSFLRWYPSVLTTAAGEVLVLGGRSEPSKPVIVPEVFSEQTGWRVLSGATHETAYAGSNWSYPRAWQAPSGGVFVAMTRGDTYMLDPQGAGAMVKTDLTLPAGHTYLPSVMYAPGRILSLRQFNHTVTIDLAGPTPTTRRVPGPGLDRIHASATVMADGRVLLNGGSLIENVAMGQSYSAQIWDSETATWTRVARAAKMRLYHSTALLLPDARVFTGGGGSPGPVRNLNAEIYTPPYLFDADGSGRLAPRPAIVSAPATAVWGETISIGIDAPGVQRVTLVKTGSATHTVDFDQRFLALDFSAQGQAVQVRLPASPTAAPPGYYMMFVFNAAGVPSVAKIIRLG